MESRALATIATSPPPLISGVALMLLALITGDLIFWNLGPMGVVVTAAFLLPANILIWKGTAHWPKSVAGSTSGRTDGIYPIALLLALINLDALVFFAILPSPLSRWAEILIGVTSIGIMVTSVCGTVMLARQVQKMRSMFLCVGLVVTSILFGGGYVCFITVILINAVMCDRLNHETPPIIGVVVGAFRGHDSWIMYSAVTTVVSALVGLFLFERLGKRATQLLASANPSLSSDESQSGVVPHLPVEPPQPRRHRWALPKALAVIFILFAVVYPFSPAAIQSRNMAKADAFIPVVRRALKGDPRFGQLRFDSFTGRQGSLLIAGEVANETDLANLKRIIKSKSPPVVVVFAVIPRDHIRELMPSTQNAPSPVTKIDTVIWV